MSNFTLTVLGTASAMPFSDRNPSAQALSVHGRWYLLDCGEGTQQQIRRFHVSFVKIEAIFISHIHGDHMFGLFGVLSTMGLFGRTAPLKVYGPAALGEIVQFYRDTFGEHIAFEVEFVKVKTRGLDLIYEDKAVRVSAFPLNHKIECYGYRFDERPLGKAPARSYAYCSDTAPFPELQQYVKGVDLLYHEATYPLQFASKAVQYCHSTTADAARTALDAGAGRLLIGHYSSRVREIEVYEQECRTIFAATTAAEDGDVVEIPLNKEEL